MAGRYDDRHSDERADTRSHDRVTDWDRRLRAYANGDGTDAEREALEAYLRKNPDDRARVRVYRAEAQRARDEAERIARAGARLTSRSPDPRPAAPEPQRRNGSDALDTARRLAAENSRRLVADARTGAARNSGAPIGGRALRQAIDDARNSGRDGDDAPAPQMKARDAVPERAAPQAPRRSAPSNHARSTADVARNDPTREISSAADVFYYVDEQGPQRSSRANGGAAAVDPQARSAPTNRSTANGRSDRDDRAAREDALKAQARREQEREAQERRLQEQRLQEERLQEQRLKEQRLQDDRLKEKRLQEQRAKERQAQELKAAERAIREQRRSEAAAFEVRNVEARAADPSSERPPQREEPSRANNGPARNGRDDPRRASAQALMKPETSADLEVYDARSPEARNPIDWADEEPEGDAPPAAETPVERRRRAREEKAARKRAKATSKGASRSAGAGQPIRLGLASAVAAASTLAVGFYLGHGPLGGDEPGPFDWRQSVAAGIALKAPESYGFAAETARQSPRVAIERLGQTLGVDLSPASAAPLGLSIKDVSLLRYGARDVGRIDYLDPKNDVVSLISIKRDAPPAVGERLSFEQTIHAGLATVEWRSDTHSFMVIGGGSAEDVLSVAHIFAKDLN